jgi:hypothetical protein
VAGGILVGYQQGFFASRTVTPVLWAMLWMSLSAGGLSLIQTLKRESASLTWNPLPLMRLTFCVVFFQAGLSKLINGGWDWINGLIFQHRLAYVTIFPFGSQEHTIFPMARALVENQGLCSLVSIAMLILELSVFLALISGRLRLLIIGALGLSQAFIFFVMSLNFLPYAVLYLAWLPWERSGAFTEKKSA